MTPCGYDGSNHQYEQCRFRVLDLWANTVFTMFSELMQIDQEIYNNIPHRNDVRLPL